MIIFTIMTRILKIKEWKKIYDDFIFPMKVVRALLTSEEPNNSTLNYCKNTIGNVTSNLNKINKKMELVFISNPEVLKKILNSNMIDSPKKFLPGKINFIGQSSEKANLILEYNWMTRRCELDIYNYLIVMDFI